MPDGPAVNVPIEAPDADRRLDLRELLSFLWRQWKFIAAIALLTFVVGATLLLRQTPLYTATAQILLERPREKVVGNDAVVSDTELNVAMIESQIAILQSTEFLRRVVERQRLAGQAKPVATASHPAGAAPAVNVPPAAEAAPDPDAIPPDELRAIGELRSALAVSRVAQRGYVLGVSMTSPDPQRAARLANAIADAYLLDKLDTRFEAARRASAWLSDRLGKLRQQLHDSEEAVSRFRSEHGLFHNGSNITLNQQQLSELNAKLVEGRATLAQQKARVELLHSIQAKGGSLLSMPDIGGGPTLAGLRQQLSTLSQQEADLTSRYGSAYPLVVNTRAQIGDVRRSIGAETARLAASINNDYELAQARVASLEKSLHDATGQTSIDDKTAIRLRELERTAAVNKTLFEEFLQRAKVTDEQATFQVHDARIITPAVPPRMPSSPRKTEFLAISLMLGLCFGVGGAVAKEMLNAGFVTPKQVEDMLGLPLLTSVNHMGPRDLTFDGAKVPIYRVPLVKPLSRYSESIRALRTGIQMADVDRPPKVIQFTSAVPGEGKTTLGLSVAVSAASSKLRALFIDADLRHPSATRAFGLQNEPGLVDLLLGAAEERDVVRFQQEIGLWTIGAGSRTQNPTDLLGSERMKRLIDGFRQNFDIVLIDTPPAGPVVDPIVVAQLTDKIVLVVHWAATARELVKQCVQQLSGHPKVAGVAFNLVDERQAGKYGRYAYSYYYSSRYYKSYYTQ